MGKEPIIFGSQSPLSQIQTFSHDLRQPLQAMALFAAALGQYISEPKGQMILGQIKLSLNQLETRITDLMDLSAITASGTKINVSEFQILDVFESLDEQAQLRDEDIAAQLPIKLSQPITRFVPSSATLKSDRGLISRILQCFISHARRYGPTARIVVGVRRLGPWAELYVIDDGPPWDKASWRTKSGPALALGMAEIMGLELGIISDGQDIGPAPVRDHKFTFRHNAVRLLVPLAED